jgi:hypothetical protein
MTREWTRACGQLGVGYHRLLTDRPFGDALREALAVRHQPA